MSKLAVAVLASVGLVGGSALAWLPEESEFDRLLRLSREGAAVVRPQAAKRLVSLGPPAAEGLVRWIQEADNPLSDLGPEVMGVLPDFGDPRLRALSWKAVDDPDFPWRPAAVLGLARSATPKEANRFVEALEDPIAKVREPAILALERLEHREALDSLRSCLEDPDDRVRRNAAKVLTNWGEPCAVTWLVEELKRDDSWFGRETGKLARYQSLKILENELATGRRTFGFEAELPWNAPDNALAATEIEAFLLDLCPDPPPLPLVARATGFLEGNVLGLEIRSCRKGEFFLRWNEKDLFSVGRGNPTRFELPEGTVARLMHEASRVLSTLEDRKVWGEPGCDSEQLFYWPRSVDRASVYRISKGQAIVEGLRPPALGHLFSLMAATVPESGTGRLVGLASQVRAALQAVGGDLPED